MEQIQTIQVYYDNLIQELEKKFEEKLTQLNKRYHVMEAGLKQKVKQLEGGKIKKKDDLESIKQKAKIFALEKQIQQLEARDNILHKHEPKMSEVQCSQEIFENVLDSIQKQLGQTDFAQFLYPQIDNLIPNLIEILPTQMSLLTDLILLVYKSKFYPNTDPNYKQLQEERMKLKTLEQHVNEVMFSGGYHQDFEICFNPLSDEWKKRIAEKEIDHVQVMAHCIKLTQSTKVQNHIIKVALQKLDTTYVKVIRDSEHHINLNFSQQLKQKQILIERLEYVLLILMLATNRESILISFNNLISDLSIENQLLLNQLLLRIKKKNIGINNVTIDLLFSLRLKDLGPDIEILYVTINIISNLQKKDILLPETKSTVDTLVQQSKNAELVSLFKAQFQ